MKRAAASYPPRDYTEYRASWVDLARLTLRVVDAAEGSAEARERLGDLAATARSWTYPVRPPEGWLAPPLASAAYAWARQPSRVLRDSLADSVRGFADAMLTMLALSEAAAPPPAPPRPIRFRQDIDG